MRKLTVVLRGANGPEELRLEGGGDRWILHRGGQSVEASVVDLPGGRISVLLADGRQLAGRARQTAPGVVEVTTARGEHELLLADSLHDRLAHPATGAASDCEEEVRALMPGRVVDVAVRDGEEVEAGTLLLVLEAMKMQNEIRASQAGTIVRCDARAGTAVDRGALLVVLRPWVKK